jgi:hypothetical protein
LKHVYVVILLNTQRSVFHHGERRRTNDRRCVVLVVILGIGNGTLDAAQELALPSCKSEKG